MANDQPQSRDALLSRIRQSRQRLDDRIAQLDREQLVASGANGRSIKDHLAHLAAWEESLLALLQGRDRNAAIGIDPSTTDVPEDVDALNAVIYRLNRDRPLPDVLDWYRDAHTRVLAALGVLADADLQKPYSAFQPGSDDTRPVVGWIMGNTYEHDDEHLPWIEQVLQAGKS